MTRAAIIGAGIAGLACARTLADQGVTVTVFEKSRGLGGRMATRRIDDTIAFDHGAQYFAVRHPLFERAVQAWRDDGVVARWQGRVVSVRGTDVTAAPASTLRFVGVPAMNAVCTHLARGMEVQRSTHVAPPDRRDGKWHVVDEGGHACGTYDWVVVAAPAPQAARLLVAVPELAARAASATMDGCWSLMVAFDDCLDVEFDAAFLEESPISWMARNTSKPGRARAVDTWVVHASPTWSHERIDDEPDSVGPLMLEAFFRASGVTPRTPLHVAPHRWRYALAAPPLGITYLLDATFRAGACGDWCAGARVEGAFTSGLGLARAILRLL